MFSFQALIVFALVFLKMAFAEHQEVEKWATLLLKLLSVTRLSFHKNICGFKIITRKRYHDSMNLIMMTVK